MKMVIQNKQKYMKYIYPAIIAIALIAIAMVFILTKNANKIKTDDSLYQYSYDTRLDYGDNVILYTSKYGTFVDYGDEQQLCDSSPLYHTEEVAFTLPNTSCYLDSDNNTEWQIPAYSVIYKDEKGIIRCSIDGKETTLNNGFIYDCKETYIFLNDLTIEYDGESVDMTAFSFYSNDDFMIRFYDYDKGVISSVDSVSTPILCKSNECQLNLTAGIFTAKDGSQRMTSASPSFLTLITEK